MINLRTRMMVTVLWLSAGALSAQQPGPMPHARPHPMSDSAMAQRQQTRMMMDSMDSRLDSLVTRMNRASSGAKVAAMADVINELVGQRKAMRANMGTMMQSRHCRMEDMMGGPADSGVVRRHPEP